MKLKVVLKIKNDNFPYFDTVLKNIQRREREKKCVCFLTIIKFIFNIYGNYMRKKLYLINGKADI